jgi:hypothetical protein
VALLVLKTLTLLALFTYGATEILIFEADLVKIAQDGGVALYRDGRRTPWCGGPAATLPSLHPPLFMIHALQG